jgi:spore coat polysaccharide biosynthesis predicted glycosyltransferase SpsG
LETGGVPLRKPSYLPLSRHIVRLAKAARPDDKSRIRLNICFGGSDPNGETVKFWQAVLKLQGLHD